MRWFNLGNGKYVSGEWTIERDTQTIGTRSQTEWVISGPNVPTGDHAPTADTFRDAKDKVKTLRHG